MHEHHPKGGHASMLTIQCLTANLGTGADLLHYLCIGCSDCVSELLRSRHNLIAAVIPVLLLVHQ